MNRIDENFKLCRLAQLAKRFYQPSPARRGSPPSKMKGLGPRRAPEIKKMGKPNKQKIRSSEKSKNKAK